MGEHRGRKRSRRRPRVRRRHSDARNTRGGGGAHARVHAKARRAPRVRPRALRGHARDTRVAMDEVVLCVNAGSSSLKIALYTAPGLERILSRTFESDADALGSIGAATPTI